VAACEILLALQILIGSEKNFERLLGSEPKQSPFRARLQPIS
jgi:hypothetical protein